ncbi:MAG: peptidase [Chitinophagaceae bacterium]|nr:MAG: peptidase [Chitinophagaceae bacterium]
MLRLLPLFLLLGAGTAAALCLGRHVPADPARVPPPVRPPRPAAVPSTNTAEAVRLRAHTESAGVYARRNGMSTRVAFLVDMRLHSGRKRFFICDLRADTVLAAGLVAHGGCNEAWLTEAAFGNDPGCGCTSTGRYRVGYAYPGRFGTAFKLFGLDPSNSNAFRRYVVLHAYDCVPDTEIYPRNICNSLGCPMVSYRFLDTAMRYIRAEKRPILLWIYP